MIKILSEKSNIIDEEKYDFWMKRFYNKLKYDYRLISIFLGLLVFDLGWIISYFNNFDKIYMTTLLVYLGVIGIILVSSCVVWGLRNYIKILNQVRPYFNVSDEEYLEVTEKWLKLIYNDKKMLNSSLFSIILSYFLVFFVYYYKFDMLMIFPIEWYLTPTFHKILIIYIYGFFVVMLIVTSGKALIYNVRLMHELGKKPMSLNVYPNLAKKLKPLFDFNLFAAFTWLIGCGLIVSAFYGNINMITLPLESILVLIGITTYLSPQISLHRTLKKTQDEILSSIDSIYEQHYNLICQKPECSIEQPDIFMKFYMLNRTRNIVESEYKNWIDLQKIMKLFGTYFMGRIIITFFITHYLNYHLQSLL